MGVNNKGYINSSNEDTNSPNNICAKNLIALLSGKSLIKQQSIYNEVFKLIESNLHLIKNMSVKDKQALNNKSNKKLEEIKYEL